MDKITKYTPIITGMLLFIGYLNYYSYYVFFDINISTYLTTGELLLSFLPLTIPILGVIGYISMMGMSTIIRIADKEDKNEEDDDSKIFLIYETTKYSDKMVELWKNKEYKNIKGVMFIILNFSVLIISLFLTILFVIYPLFLFVYSVSEKWHEIPALIFYITSAIWFIGFFAKLDKGANILNKGKGYINSFVMIMLFIACLWITNKQKAYKVLNGNSNERISFLYKDELITTDGNKVYVGKTNNYIFLRNLKENMNEIYFLNEINKIEITKIKDKVVED